MDGEWIIDKWWMNDEWMKYVDGWMVKKEWVDEYMNGEGWMDDGSKKGWW